jgi:N-alpha-acetyltransferase 35, NatC auxiliary subunit
LNVGQVVRAADFSFLDALAALEILDPKTDSGMITTGEDDIDIGSIETLLPEEVVWIMDQLLAREVIWRYVTSSRRSHGIMEIP